MTGAQCMNGGTPHGQPTILLVEDEIITRAVMAQELRGHGYEVIEAGSGDEAASVLRSGVSLDVVVTDLMMPGSLGGGELVRLIRAQFTYLKVIMLSASEPEADVRRLLDRFIAKPMLPSDLVGHMRALVLPRVRTEVS